VSRSKIRFGPEPAARHLFASASRHHLADPRAEESSRQAATCAQGAQVPRCLAAHEPGGDGLRIPGRPSLRHQGHRPTGPLVRASRPARGHQARDGGSRGERTGPCKRLAPPLAPEAGSQRPWPSSGSGKSPFNLQELRPRPSTSLPRNDQAMQAVKDQNQRSQHAFELRKRGAKEIRTPDLLHAIQIRPIAGCGWKWPCQQLQSPHIAQDGLLTPLACSPSCSPPACLSLSRQHPTACPVMPAGCPSHSTASCTYSPAAARARRLALSAC
jgi:hypothetical protein